MTYESVILRREGERATLTFNRPDRRNALTHQMMAEIGLALEEIAADAGIRVLILRGAGHAFSAGGDLDAMANMPPPPAPGEEDPLYAPYRAYGDVLARLNGMTIPVVAVVAGAAAGGGFGMACCADVVIVHEAAKFGMPEPRSGFIPSQIIPYVVRRIGEGQARRLAVTGRTVDGREAVALGIGQFCCATAEDMEATLARVLDDIHRCEPEAVAAVKGLVLACAEEGDEAVFDAAADALVRLLRRPDALAGIEAFLAKRRPPWAE